VVFAVAILLMVVAGELVTRVAEKLGRGDGESSDVRLATHGKLDDGQCPAGRRLVVPVIAVLLVVPAMLYQATTPEVVVAEAPDVSLGELEGFSSEQLEVSEAELTVLPKDTIIHKRRYEAPNGDWVAVTIVVGGRSKSSIHRPELCLPAQGFEMRNPRTRSVGGRDWRFIELASKDSPPYGFAYTFFNQEGYATASHVSRIFRDVVDRSLLNRIDRWVMVSVHSSRADDLGLSALLSRIEFGLEGKTK